LDVTPFVGRLVDGGSHDVALTVANIGDTWNAESAVAGEDGDGGLWIGSAYRWDRIAVGSPHGWGGLAGRGRLAG
jgi:hypothetical protein